MQIVEFTAKIIAPYHRNAETKIDRLAGILSDNRDLMNYLDTFEMEFMNHVNVDLDPDLNASEIGETLHGTVISSIKVTTQNQKMLSTEELSAIMRRYTSWVGTWLSQNKLDDYIRFLYPMLILSKTQPPNIAEQLRADGKLRICLTLSFMPTALKFREEILGENLAVLETNMYIFSPFGALIADPEYDETEPFVNTLVLPLVSRLRGIEILLDELNRDFNKRKIAPIVPHSKRIADRLRRLLRRHASHEIALQTQWQELATLRESLFVSLAATDYSESQVQLSAISDELNKTFGIDKLRSSLENRIETLNSILERLIEDRIDSFNKTIGKITVVLTFLTVVLGLFALPSFIDWFWRTLHKSP